MLLIWNHKEIWGGNIYSSSLAAPRAQFARNASCTVCAWFSRSRLSERPRLFFLLLFDNIGIIDQRRIYSRRRPNMRATEIPHIKDIGQTIRGFL